MHKSDLRFMGPHARFLINKAYALCFELHQALFKVGDLQQFLKQTERSARERRRKPR